MMQPKHIYTTGVITGALCGVFGALMMYRVTNYIVSTVAKNGEASIWPVALIMGMGGAVIGAVVAAIVHKLNK